MLWYHIKHPAAQEKKADSISKRYKASCKAEARAQKDVQSLARRGESLTAAETKLAAIQQQRDALAQEAGAASVDLEQHKHETIKVGRRGRQQRDGTTSARVSCYTSVFDTNYCSQAISVTTVAMWQEVHLTLHRSRDLVGSLAHHADSNGQLRTGCKRCSREGTGRRTGAAGQNLQIHRSLRG